MSVALFYRASASPPGQFADWVRRERLFRDSLRYIYLRLAILINHDESNLAI